MRCAPIYEVLRMGVVIRLYVNARLYEMYGSSRRISPTCDTATVARAYVRYSSNRALRSIPGSRPRPRCHGNQIPYLFHAHLKHCQGTMLEPSTSHIGQGVALHAQAAALVYSRVYKRPTLSGRLNDHSDFPCHMALPVRHSSHEPLTRSAAPGAVCMLAFGHERLLCPEARQLRHLTDRSSRSEFSTLQVRIL